MPLYNELNKVLILGSGPNIVGQISKMDILTEQALTAFIEDDLQIVLINPDPATIETDPKKNIKVYLEPLTLSCIKRIIRMEKPDALLTAFGGKPALQLANQLADDGILREMSIKLLTVNTAALKLKEYNNYHDFLEENKLPVAQQWKLDESQPIEFQLKGAHYPLLITKKQQYRPTLHFSVTSFEEVQNYFNSEEELEYFDYTDYRLNEDLSDWQEIILDVLRDNDGNFCFVNGMDSLEPISINSADSLLVSPIVTRNNNQIQSLRNCVRKIADSLNLNGTLTISFAVKQNGDNFVFKVLGIKPCLTQTSLITYRSCVYSIGYVVAKIAVGYNLNEIIDPQSGLNAAIEPVKDHFVIKLPHWSFTQTEHNHYRLGSKVSSSGQALGIGLNFESALMKALQSTSNFNNNYHVFNLEINKPEEEIISELLKPSEHHLITILAACFKDIDYSVFHKDLKIHPVFLQKFTNITRHLKVLQSSEIDSETLLKAKRLGFSNELLAHFLKCTPTDVRNLLKQNKIIPSYIELDGTAGITRPKVQAVFSGFDIENEINPINEDKKVLVIGLNPFQVSQTGEFDYMLYHATKTLKTQGYCPIIISNNPESISNAYDASDRIYFEPITIETILNIAEKENIKYVLTQFSGKQINQLRNMLLKFNLKVLGQENLTEILQINVNEKSINKHVKIVPSLRTENKTDALAFANNNGFPILIGGISNNTKQKSAVIFDVPALKKYIDENDLNKITISKFIEGKKYEITAISDGKNVTIPGIIEHFEQTGSHASDSIALFSPQNLSSKDQEILKDASIDICNQMFLKGLINLHFLITDEQIYILQVKTYAGHNVAFLSKSLSKDIVAIATKALIDISISDQGFKNDIWPASNLIHVKMPAFSKLRYESDNSFDSKMKTSANVMGRATFLPAALYKGYEASNLIIPSYGTVFISVKDSDKRSAVQLASRFHKLGFSILATEGTANFIAEEGITTGIIEKIQEGSNSLLDKILQHKINIVINITSLSDSASHDAISIKDQALSTHIPVFSSLQSAEYILTILENLAMTTQPL